MRILLTSHQFLPDHATGTEILSSQVALELARRGHEVRIITGYPLKQSPANGIRFDHYDYRGLPVARYFHQEGAAVGEQANLAEIEYDNHLFANWLHGYLAEWQPDIAHFFHLKNLSAAAIDVCHARGIPMVMTPTDFWLVCPTVQLLLPDGSRCAGPDQHGTNCLRHAIQNTRTAAGGNILAALPNAWFSVMLRLACGTPLSTRPPFSYACALSARGAFLRQRARLLDHVLAPTRLMQQLLTDNGIMPARMSLSRFGIDLAGFLPSEARRGTKNKLRIGFIGSLAHPKGAHVLIGALRLTSATLPIELQIYGNPSVYPEYAAMLWQLAGDDPRIRFCNTFPNDEIGGVFDSLDVLVVPSLWYENTPLVIYSAQAAGCPILASDLAGMSEVIRDGVDGMLFPPGDSNALAALIDRLCNARELVGQLADNAPRPKSMIEYTDEIIGVYQDVLAHKGVVP